MVQSLISDVVLRGEGMDSDGPVVPTRLGGGLSSVLWCSVRQNRGPVGSSNPFSQSVPTEVYKNTDGIFSLEWLHSFLTISTEISTAGISPLFSSQCRVFLSSGQPTPGP